MARSTKSQQQGTTESDVFSNSRPATSEEVAARAGRPQQAADATPEQQRHQAAPRSEPDLAREEDPTLQPAAGPTGASDGDD